MRTPLLRRSLMSGGRLAGVLAAVILTLAAALLVSRGPTLAQNEMALGVDMEPEGNTATLVGAVQTCTEVQIGDQFAVDVFVRDVQDLAAWELRIAFNHSVLSLEETDYSLLLLSTAPSGSIYPSLFDVETPDRYFLAAAEFRGTPDDGSGVLTRLQLKAVGQGRSPLSIVSEPSFLRPRLTNGAGQPIGPSNIYGLWDSAITGGEVAVGEPCSPSSTPSPTPSPTPSSTPSPTPSSALSSTPSPSSPPAQVAVLPTLSSLSDVPPPGPPSGGGEEDELAAEVAAPPALVSLSDVPPHDPPSGGEEAATAPDNESEAEGTEATPDSMDGEGPPLPSDPTGPNSDGGGSSGFSLWLLGAVMAAALVMGTGGIVVVHMLRTRS